MQYAVYEYDKDIHRRSAPEKPEDCEDGARLTLLDTISEAMKWVAEELKDEAELDDIDKADLEYELDRLALLDGEPLSEANNEYGIGDWTYLIEARA